MHLSRIPALAASALLLLLIVTIGSPASAQTIDPRAEEVVDRLLDRLGGLDTFHNTRFVRFTFIRGEAAPIGITWDKWDGRYRLDTTRENEPWVVLMNVNTREGRSWIGGRPSEGEALQAELQQALRMWAGEIYWFLAPFKLRDEGAIVRHDGEETIEGATYDRLHVSYEQVGLTPGDQFWMYVNRETALMDRWRFELRGGGRGDFWWREWRQHGPLTLSGIREAADSSVTIRMEDIYVGDTMDDEVFESPEPARQPS